MVTEEEQKLTTLVAIFNRLFAESENTLLKPGADEPFYQAASPGHSAVVYSRENYFSSALHEIAHWCIAGRKRRQLDDFGYWYAPEGRSLAQQLEFEKVEIKPQAIEWALADACCHVFHFSADNLSQDIDASADFQQAVTEQLASFRRDNNFPPRAALLIGELQKVFAEQKQLEVAGV